MNFFEASVLGFSQTRDGLHPAKALFYAFSDALARCITWVAGGPPVDGRTTGRVPGNVWRHVDLAQFHDEVSRIEAFIATQRDGFRSVGARLNHVERSQPFGMAGDPS